MAPLHKLFHHDIFYISDTDAVEVHDVFVGNLSHHAGCLKEGQ